MTIPQSRKKMAPPQLSCHLLVTAATLLLLCTQCGAAVECFVCSYAPRSNSSRIDGCTENNFTDIVIDTRSCDFGCERVASFDSNGALESYHRNCAHHDTVLTNSCETVETVILTKVVCACDYSYCNTASAPLGPTIHLVQCGTLLAVMCYVWSSVTAAAFGRRSSFLLLSSPP